MAIHFGSRLVLKVLALFLCVAVVYARLTFNNYSEKSSSNAPLVPALIIFGDSTVDAGNNNYLATVVKSDFEPYGMSFIGDKPTGRFCDGLLSVDYISAKIGLPQFQLPYLAPNAHGEAILTGINFASSASGWDDDTAEHFNVKGLNYQFDWYKNYQKEVLAVAGPQRGNFILSNALYAFSTGANDWVNNYFLNPVLMREKTIDQYKAFLLSQSRKYIQELYSLGGRNIAVLSLPPLGCLPSQITLHGNGNQGCIQEFNDICQSFNKALIAQIDEMKANMPGSRLLYIDIYTYLNEVFHNPTPYGFTETRTACCGTGDLETAILCNEASIGTCSNAYPFLFFDSFHPTDHFNSQLADQMFAYAKPIILGPSQP